MGDLGRVRPRSVAAAAVAGLVELVPARAAVVGLLLREVACLTFIRAAGASALAAVVLVRS